MSEEREREGFGSNFITQPFNHQATVDGLRFLCSSER